MVRHASTFGVKRNIVSWGVAILLGVVVVGEGSNAYAQAAPPAAAAAAAPAPAPAQAAAAAPGAEEPAKPDQSKFIDSPGSTEHFTVTLGAVGIAPFTIEENSAGEFYLEDSSDADVKGYVEFRFRKSEVFDQTRRLIKAQMDRKPKKDVSDPVVAPAAAAPAAAAPAPDPAPAAAPVAPAAAAAPAPAQPAEETSPYLERVMIKPFCDHRTGRKTTEKTDPATGKKTVEIEGDRWRGIECIDFDARVEFTFAGGSELSASTIAGAGNFSAGVTASWPMIGPVSQAFGWSLGPAAVFTVQTDRQVQDVHDRIGLGGVLKIGLTVAPLALPRSDSNGRPAHYE